ncbi:hypothetical protein HYALB_00008937 [Hymenoscyphus albidus]|uniref:DUF8035 domain-containing protein n=1 Tax=Hymenoscyphus albidus TaxID=595503 RepID=A0A9N9LMA2_9HELO|nr:hypothetical protein HYALB_00008937 [Hymenoscyphus albidus]
MSRDPYRSSAGDLGLGARGAERWDAERFNQERDRERFARERERERYEERDTRVSMTRNDHGSSFGGPRGPRDRSFDEVYERERRGPRGYEDEYERRHYHDEEPRFERERPMGRNRGQSITIEKEREVYERSPPRRAGNRPAFLRRQSSLDTFDRKPLIRFNDHEEYGPPARRHKEYDPPSRWEREEFREEYGPPARYERREELRPPPLTPIPLPKTRALPPPRRYEREYYDEIKVAEPDFYGDDDFRGYPERVREREIIRRRRRRSRSKDSRSSRGESRVSHSHRGSVRSSSQGSSSSDESFETVRSEFPKKGKTRMPARLVNTKAIIDLGYPFIVEGDTIIIQKALGRENIDEVIKLSEDYNKGPEMSGGRSEAGTVVEEHRTEVITVPAAPAPPPPAPVTWASPPPPAGWVPPPAPSVHGTEVVQETKIVDIHREPSPAPTHSSYSTHSTHHTHHTHHHDPIILTAEPHHDKTTYVKEEYIERSDPIPIGPLALALPAERHRVTSERAIRAEIKALEAEKEALKAQRRADRELQRAQRYRGERVSETDLVVYDRDRYEGEEVTTLVRTERVAEPEGGVRIVKDKKGRMSISVPKYV